MQALINVVGGLPAGFEAAVVVLQHVDARFRSCLVQILGRAAAMRASAR